MNRIVVFSLACLLICSLTPLNANQQNKTDAKANAETQTSRGNGTVKFFNNSKGFGFISNDSDMIGLLQQFGEICAGPTTGCTFEIIDILNGLLPVWSGKTESSTDDGNRTLTVSRLAEEFREGDQSKSNEKEATHKAQSKFKSGADLSSSVN